MTTPILSYNCEIWGANQKQDFKTWDGSPIEKAPAKTKVLSILKKPHGIQFFYILPFSNREHQHQAYSTKNR